MPTTGHDDEEVGVIYEELDDTIRNVRGEENLIIMVDWSTVVGEEKDGSVVGCCGLGKRNKRGERLIKFCIQCQLVVTNT